MKKAALAVLLLGAALCIPGCGFEEGAGASVTVIQATPTPIPTPTPEATPTPEVTPTPEPVVEQTASGVNVTKQDGTYVANADINLRADASADATWIAGVTSGTQMQLWLPAWQTAHSLPALVCVTMDGLRFPMRDRLLMYPVIM